MVHYVYKAHASTDFLHVNLSTKAKTRAVQGRQGYDGRSAQGWNHLQDNK